MTTALHRTKWFLPGFALALGLVFLAVFWAGGIDLRATALAGLVAITAILVMCAWEWGHGRDGSPYVQLGAISGVAYVVAVAVLRWRS